jgi:hypothetical protein
MDERHAAIRESQAAQSRGEHHAFARGAIARSFPRAAEVLAAQSDALQRERIGEGVGFARNVGFDAVRQRIHADGRGERGGHGKRELEIDDGRTREQRCAQHHHLHVPRGVGDNGDLRCLTARSGGGRHRDQGEAGPRDSVQPHELRQQLRVGWADRDYLGRVDRRTATHGDDDVGTMAVQCRHSSGDVFVGGVGLHVVKYGHGEPGIDKRVTHLPGDAELDHARIGYEQDACAAQFPHEVGQAMPAAASVQNYGRSIEAIAGGRGVHVHQPIAETRLLSQRESAFFRGVSNMTPPIPGAWRLPTKSHQAPVI